MKYRPTSLAIFLVAPALAHAKPAPRTSGTMYLEEPPARPGLLDQKPASPAATSPGLLDWLHWRSKAPAPATVAPTPPPVPVKVSKPKVKAAAAPPPPSAPALEKKRWFSFFQRKPAAASAPVKPEPSAKLAKSKPTPPATTPAPEPKPEAAPKLGFFARLFGGKAGQDEERSEMDKANRPPRPADWESKFVVSMDHVEAFRFGPSGSHGADKILNRGTVVTMKKHGRAWAEVEVEDGHVYTVGADQVRAAKESDFAPPPPVILPAAQPAGGPNSSLMIDPLPVDDLPSVPQSSKPAQQANELLTPALPALPPQ